MMLRRKLVPRWQSGCGGPGPLATRRLTSWSACCTLVRWLACSLQCHGLVASIADIVTSCICRRRAVSGHSSTGPVVV